MATAPVWFQPAPAAYIEPNGTDPPKKKRHHRTKPGCRWGFFRRHPKQGKAGGMVMVSQEVGTSLIVFRIRLAI